MCMEIPLPECDITHGYKVVDKDNFWKGPLHVTEVDKQSGLAKMVVPELRWRSCRLVTNKGYHVFESEKGAEVYLSTLFGKRNLYVRKVEVYPPGTPFIFKIPGQEEPFKGWLVSSWRPA